VGVEQQYCLFLFEDFVSQKEPNVRWNLFCSDFPTVKRLANEIGIRHSDLSQMAIRRKNVALTDLHPTVVLEAAGPSFPSELRLASRGHLQKL
jgi:hypothetical protein